MTKEKLKEKLLNIALENSFIAGIILFGSVARGEETEKSDIDLLVLWEGLNPNDSYSYVYRNVSKYFLHESVTILDMNYYDFLKVKDVTALYINIVWDGIVIYDKYGKLESFLEKVKNELIAKGIERKKVGKYYYWKLPKPGQKVKLEI
ncbi:MAG: nucleotidyltransferase family protein [Thermoproteota archaeon]